MNALRGSLANFRQARRLVGGQSPLADAILTPKKFQFYARNATLTAGALFSGFLLIGVADLIIAYFHERKDRASRKDRPAISINEVTETVREEAFDSIAKTWDSRIWLDEWLLGHIRLRKVLARQAKGDVLEVAAGTGRNLKYYPWPLISSLVCIDSSRQMLERLLKTRKAQLAANDQSKVRVIQARVGSEAPLADFPDSSFDSVVDTFGICSFENPHEALKEMARVCKKDGKILLLEHGLGTYDIVNNFLNKSALKQVCKYGCYHNRDILKVVAEADLEIESVSRKNFGTTYMIVARPRVKVVQ